MWKVEVILSSPSDYGEIDWIDWIEGEYGRSMLTWLDNVGGKGDLRLRVMHRPTGKARLFKIGRDGRDWQVDVEGRILPLKQGIKTVKSLLENCNA